MLPFGSALTVPVLGGSIDPHLRARSFVSINSSIGLRKAAA
jgi:hypothetical protein